MTDISAWRIWFDSKKKKIKKMITQIVYQQWNQHHTMSSLWYQLHLQWLVKMIVLWIILLSFLWKLWKICGINTKLASHTIILSFRYLSKKEKRGGNKWGGRLNTKFRKERNFFFSDLNGLSALEWLRNTNSHLCNKKKKIKFVA